MERWRRGAPRGSCRDASSSASRAEVPEPHGERSTSPSANTVTLRWDSGGPSVLLLPEDDAVDVTQLRLERVHDLVGGLELALDLPSQLDQARQLGRAHPLLERGVERSPEGDVHLVRTGRHPRRPDEGGHVAEAHRAHQAVLDARPCLEAAGRHVDDDAVHALAALDDPLVQRPGDERDRAVPARGRVAGVVEEDDAEVGAVVVRRDDVAAVHVGVAARLEDEQAAHVVEAREGVAPALEHRAPPQLARRRR